jgi:hypothetical protein
VELLPVEYVLAGHTEHALMSLAPTAKQFAEVQMEIVPNKALSLSLSLSLSLEVQIYRQAYRL